MGERGRLPRKLVEQYRTTFSGVASPGGEVYEAEDSSADLDAASERDALRLLECVDVNWSGEIISVHPKYLLEAYQKTLELKIRVTRGKLSS